MSGSEGVRSQSVPSTSGTPVRHFDVCPGPPSPEGYDEYITEESPVLVRGEVRCRRVQDEVGTENLQTVSPPGNPFHTRNMEFPSFLSPIPVGPCDGWRGPGWYSALSLS